LACAAATLAVANATAAGAARRVNEQDIADLLYERDPVSVTSERGKIGYPVPSPVLTGSGSKG
jgi:hypothetical protein